MPLRSVSPKTSAVSEPQLAFDIVAVHGLGGGPWSTWTHSENGKCWIKDFLPLDCKDARILSYEYQTTFALEEIVQSIHTISRQLLESLETWRSQNPCRPLIFVAHSLGGIIVKDALGHAQHEPQEYGNTYSSTRGIVFFGTPHRGIEKADWGSMVRGIVSVVRQAPTNYVVNELKIDSPTLSRISYDFRLISNSWALVSFFEQKPMSPLNRLIVPQWSAQLDYGNEVAIPRPEDHINMCKFATQDEDYRTVVRRIQKIAKGSGPLIKEEQERCIIRPRGRLLHRSYIGRPNISSIIDAVCRESLNSRSEQPKKCLVYGIGGSGKSSICLEFFEDDRHQFYHRIWIDASSENKLRQDFDRAADSIDLPGNKRGPEGVISWLERQTKTWLLVFDDVSAGNSNLRRYLPGGVAGFILFSSQRSISWMDKVALVEGLSPEDASKLLLETSGKEVDRPNLAVGELTLALKYLPLAICVAGAFIRHRDYTIVQYLQEWKWHIFKEKDDSDDTPPHEKSLNATFRMTIEDMKILNQAGARVASDLLKLVAFLDHKHISEQIFHDAWQYRYDQYQHKRRLINPGHTWIESLETGDPKAYNAVHSEIKSAFSFLKKYSLFTVDKVEGSEWRVLSVHSLIQVWIRKSMNRPERRSWCTKTAIILATNFDRERPMSSNLVSHLEHMRETSSEEPFKISDLRCDFSEDKSFVPSCFADIYSWQGYFVEAKDLRTAMYRKLSPSDDLCVQIDCISVLAESLRDLGEHHEASWYYQKAYEIACRPAFYQKGLKCTMRAMDCAIEVARNARDLENHAKAFRMHDGVWRETERLHNEHPSHRELEIRYIRASRERAVSMLALGDSDDAVGILEVLVQSHQKIAKCDDHDLLRSRSALANAYSRVGRHNDAYKERKEVLRQRNANTMEQGHPDRLIAQECVALSLDAMGQHHNACYLRMDLSDEWKSCKRQITVDHPALLTAKMNLAHSYEVFGYWRRAEEIYDEVYECKRLLAISRHWRYCQCSNRDEPLLCEKTHKVFGTDEAIEALEGKALVQFQLQDKNSADQTFAMIMKIWSLKLKAAPYQERKYLASVNRLVKVEGNDHKRIALREEVLARQLRDAKRTQTDALMTILYLGLDYYTIGQYEEVYRHLGTVLKEGKILKTMLPKEFEEAEKAYEKVREARKPPQSATSTQRPPVSTPQSPQQGNFNQVPRGFSHAGYLGTILESMFDEFGL